MYPDDQNPHSPYEFIMNPQQQKRRLALPGVRDPFISKLILIVMCVVAVVIVGGVIVSSFLGKSGVNVVALTGVAQTQQELVRVAQQGVAQGTQPVTRNFAISVQISIQSEQLQLLSYLKGQGHKLSTKTLSLKKSTTTDTQLTNALQTSTFDSTFVQLMQNSLVSYNTELEQVLGSATGVNEKKILNADSSYANALLQQVPTQESLQNGS